MKHIAITLLASLSLVASNSFAQEDGHHTPHEHGSANLMIAIEADRLDIQLSSPAMNFLGFEHRPETQQEWQNTERLSVQLQQFNELFILPDSAQCRLENTEIHGIPVRDDSASHSPAEHNSSHSDIEAHYQLLCNHSSALTELNTQLFRLFPDLEEIDAQWITGEHQNMMELNPGNAKINLQ